jgi:multidrug efflux pump subunit AcrA (membrane-fusion protein)
MLAKASVEMEKPWVDLCRDSWIVRLPMIRSSALHLVPALIAAASHAGEITVEHRPFTVEKSFSATALPEDGSVLIQIEPQSWSDFEILDVLAHGSKVSKGDVLVRFDAEAIDKKIADSRRALESGALALAQAELDLKNLQETTPHQLDAYRRAAEVAKEEHGYFTKTRRKATEESAAQELKRQKQLLANQEEELKQLAKMYAADDLTEETEEIILTRQKNAVEAAEFALRMETLDYQRKMDISLPREALSLANAERDSALALLKAEQDLPRAIAIQQIELETLKTNRERETETLAKLEKDRSLFEIKAPADGVFFHGSIENGRWTTGEAVKAIIKHGRPAVNRPFATFVPSTAKLALIAFLDEASARSLTPEVSGTATLGGREDIEIPVKLAKLATVPGPESTYRADLVATWPKNLTPVTGSTAQVRIIAYHQPEAIFVPTKALTYDHRGWTIEVKLADGKTERRPVKRGRVSGENTEVVSGLEAGQVFIAPEK